MMTRLPKPLFALLLSMTATEAAELSQQFSPKWNWSYHGEVAAVEKGIKVTSAGNQILTNVSADGKYQGAPLIATKEKFSDVHLKMEFMVPKGSNSGVYFMGRYEIQILDSFGKPKAGLGDLGGLYQRWDDQRNPKGFEGVAPKVNAAKPAGEWQTMEVIFRAPRFAENGAKTHHAKFLNVLINGQLVHENQVAKGPTRSGKYLGESADAAAIFIQGDHGPIAIRKIELKKLELKTDGETVIEGAEATPLDDQGRAMINAVTFGSELFKSKGCAECHGVNDGEIKTGPSLHGLFTKNGRKTKVYLPSEGHQKEVPADLNYLKSSLRRSMEELSYQADGKPYLPIMPPFSFKQINDDDASALYTYLQTLNAKEQAGNKVVWVKKPSAKYALKDDPIAIHVKSYPRLERVDMGEHVSARAYHVGLPGDISYTFDPRTMAIAQVWDGPFMRKKDQVDRGRGGAEKGFKHRDYKISNLFQPYDAKGQLVDLTHASPARMSDPKQSNQFLRDKADFLAVAKDFPATFLSVDTPRKKVPTFHYSVGPNHVALKLELSNKGLLEATIDCDLKSEQHLAIPVDKLTDIVVSLGEIRDKKWILSVGKHQGIRFSASLPNLAGELYSSDLATSESDAAQPLQWTPAAKQGTLPSGYRLDEGSAPTGPFGRPLVFEPMGIEFHQGEAYVSTRTAGIWKVVDGKWQLFAEGAYEALGLIVHSKNEIVIGEKPGLTRLIDADGDHWAEKRENITDQFRFNGDYHEYLHGPIELDGRYLFSLNLGNEVKGMYKANGAWMGTVGGLRGWMLSADAQGNTERFASGFRSPAGLSLSPEKEIVYTENQGEYVGTSKMFKVKKGKFYGNPTGLLDTPGLNVDSPETKWAAVKDRREQPILLLPHNEVMNAPGSPEFLTSKINFGPFQGQMFLGDQVQSNIYRVDTEVINKQEQAVAIPFMQGLRSGAMRLRFNPSDSSLWIGQTGRGWRSKGGSTYALQRISYDPAVPVDAIKTLKVTPQGFDIHFTQAQSGADETQNVKCHSWYYLNSEKYGSPEQGKREESITASHWNAEKTILHLTLKDFKVAQKKDSSDSSRVYELNLAQTAFGKKNGTFLAKAYYTLHHIPLP